MLLNMDTANKMALEGSTFDEAFRTMLAASSITGI